MGDVTGVIMVHDLSVIVVGLKLVVNITGVMGTCVTGMMMVRVKVVMVVGVTAGS